MRGFGQPFYVTGRGKSHDGKTVLTLTQGRNWNVNWKSDIHILMFSPNKFISNQIQKKSPEKIMTIGIYPPPQ